MKYVALLRAVNVGGVAALLMAKLRATCADAGFTDVETYIASGNVVFESKAASAEVKAALEKRLSAQVGRPLSVVVRTAAELTAVLKANPFPEAEPKHTYAIFLDGRPPRDALERATGRTNEAMRLGAKEIYVHYPSGMGRSRLRIPEAKTGTARNMNTITKLAKMAAKR